MGASSRTLLIFWILFSCGAAVAYYFGFTESSAGDLSTVSRPVAVLAQAQSDPRPRVQRASDAGEIPRNARPQPGRRKKEWVRPAKTRGIPKDDPVPIEDGARSLEAAENRKNGGEPNEDETNAATAQEAPRQTTPLPRESVEPKWAEASKNEAFTFSGLVRDMHTGNPIAGARVSVAGRRGRTNKDGVFDVEIPRTDRATVYVHKRGYLTAQRTLPTAEPVTIGIWPGIIVKGVTLEAPSGTPIAGVRVDCGFDRTVTDKRGRFELSACSAGNPVLSATHDEFVLARASLGNVPSRVEVSNAVLHLERGGTRIRGTVRESSGKALRADLAAYPLTASGAVDGPAFARTQARDNGLFDFGNLPTGRWRIQAVRFGRETSVDYHLTAGDKRIALTLPNGRTISGRVTRAGAAQENVAITLDCSGAAAEEPTVKASLSEKLLTHTDASGAFEFKGAAPFPCVLHADDTRLGRITLAAPVAETEISFALSTGSSIYGQLVDSRGAVRRVDGTAVAYALPATGAPGIETDLVKGSFSFASLTPGTYQLATIVENGVNGEPLLLTVEEGEPTLVSWTLPRPGSLTFKVADDQGAGLSGVTYTLTGFVTAPSGAPPRTAWITRGAGHDGDRTEIKGVHGPMQLTIHAPGFEDRIIRDIAIATSEVLDLGEVQLSPTRSLLPEG